jgi:hypothetical protein
MTNIKQVIADFDNKFGINLIKQKTKLYSDGKYSKGIEKDYQSAKEETREIKDFLQSSLLNQLEDIKKWAISNKLRADIYNAADQSVISFIDLISYLEELK